MARSKRRNTGRTSAEEPAIHRFRWDERVDAVEEFLSGLWAQAWGGGDVQ